jgi:hypothetical protein
VRRNVNVLAVAVLVATVLVISSTAASARPLRGGLPLQKPELSHSFVCEMMLDGNHPHFGGIGEGNHPRFRETAPEPPESPTEGPSATCWHVSPGLGRASDVVPPPT